MLSKATIKLINSLSVKKYRDEQKLFIAEGEKLVREILESDLTTRLLYLTAESKINHPKADIVLDIEMKKISCLKNHSSALAVVEIPQQTFNTSDFNNNLILALDNIQDPGNLGTIIRIADWFGIRHILCSLHTADCYNPKTIQATMGAITRVKLYYTNLSSTLKRAQQSNTAIFGTFLNGKNIYTEQLNETGVIIMGNEGQGISPEIETFVSNKLTIPPHSTNNTSESLNVAVATAIICSEFQRR